ncbi:MAG: hypothetical protein CM1200mP10_28270 [Candidatus Neomarinimicrobiota bacterium]|nr:MAG: hypothetical protein CM1200mP10_28270 [Candidatus Neomarinimicrobiota bacterium]
MFVMSSINYWPCSISWDISSQMVQIVLPRNFGTLGGTIRHISYGIFEGFDNNGTPHYKIFGR